MKDCIFCQIANGTIPSSKVFENDDFVAFNDLAPTAPVHVLVVPKQHVQSINQITDAETEDQFAHFFQHRTSGGKSTRPCRKRLSRRHQYRC